MVSTWRFYSFKDIDFRSRHPFRLIVLIAALFALDLVLFSACALRHRDALHGVRRSLALAVDFPPQPRLPPPSYRRHRKLHERSIQIRPVATDLRGAKLYRVAIVGAASLKGKEIAEILRERNFPAVDIRLLDDDESLGQLEAVGDEMSFIQSIRAEQFERVDFTFFASDQGSTRTQLERRARLWQHHHRSLVCAGRRTGRHGPLALDRARDWPILPPELQPGPLVTAHPAAVTLALLLLRAEKVGAIQSAVATVLSPPPSTARRGMDELHEQTVNLLSFQELPKNVFDVQIAFNHGRALRPEVAATAGRGRGAHPAALPPDCPGDDAPSPRCYCCRRPSSTDMRSPCISRWRSQSRCRVFAGLGGRHVNHPLRRRRCAQQRERRRAGRHPVWSMKADPAHERRLALGRGRQPARLRLTAVECAETMTATRPRGRFNDRDARALSRSPCSRSAFRVLGCGYHTVGT